MDDREDQGLEDDVAGTDELLLDTSYSNPTSTIRPNTRTQSEPKNQRCFVLLCVLFVLHVILSAAGYYHIKSKSTEEFSILKKHIESLEEKITSMSATVLVNKKEAQSENQKLADRLVFDNRNVTAHITSILGELGIHQAVLDRLSNGTSNADVLDKLKLTEANVAMELTEVKGDVVDSLNKSKQMIYNQLTSNMEEMENTKKEIESQMKATQKKMKSVLTETTSNIYEVEKNVTVQLDTMESQLGATSSALDMSVMNAQLTIKAEVQNVRGRCTMGAVLLFIHSYTRTLIHSYTH